MLVAAPTWVLLVHVVVSAWVACLMARREPVLPFLAGLVFFILYSDNGAMPGLIASVLVAFVLGLIDTQRE